jgi:hypothetical protein
MLLMDDKLGLVPNFSRSNNVGEITSNLFFSFLIIITFQKIYFRLIMIQKLTKGTGVDCTTITKKEK